MEIILKASAFVMSNMEIILSFVGAMALIATKTPNKTDDKILQVILDLVNFAGANAGKASNKED